MKKMMILVLIVAILALSACSGKAKDTGNVSQPGEQTDVSQTETVEQDGESDVVEAEKSEDNAVRNANTTRVYTCDSVIEVPMGAGSMKLCDVKMGADYLLSGELSDEAGKTEDIGSAVSSTVAEISFDDKFVTKAYVGSQGNINDTYAFGVYLSSETSVEDVESTLPNGVKIDSDADHYAYFTEDGRFAALFVYKLSDDYTLMIGYDGGLVDKMSAEEIAHEFYNLVTPVN